jgi:organic radical activating enzyme
MLDNGKHEVCNRCWYEESVGMSSQRTRLQDTVEDPETLLKNHKQGPLQLAIKVGNVCNLRCRSCNSADSVTLSIEGQYYADTYGFKNNMWLLETEPKVFTDQQIDEIVSVCDNVQRIEFYGGEPLVDKQMPKLLKKLVDLNLAKQIQLNISTNITHRMDDELINTLGQFNQVNINLSIDGWGDKFTYLRHPAEWNKVYDNIKWFIALRDSKRVEMSLLPAATVTIMNVYDLPELITNLHTDFNLPIFLILAGHPSYFNIQNIPLPIAEKIIENLEGFELHDLSPIINSLRSTGNEENWVWFNQVTRAIDKYRNESFSKTFSKYHQMIVDTDPTWEVI